MSDHREFKVRKGLKEIRGSREFREFKVLREMLEPKGPLGLRDLRVMSGRKDVLVLMVPMGRPC